MISVVMAVYKNYSRCKIALEGYLHQDIKDFVLHVVNDGGDYHKMEEVVAPFKNKINLKYHFVHTPKNHYCVGTAKNVGIHFSETSRVVLVDGDCVPDIKMVSEHAKYGNENLIVAGTRKRVKFYDSIMYNDVFQKAYRWDDRFMQEGWRKKRYEEKVVKMMQPNAVFPELCHGFNVSYPTNIVKKIGGHCRKYEGIHNAQDQDLAYRACLMGCTTFLNKNIIVYHLDHELTKCNPKGIQLFEETQNNPNPIRNGGKLMWYKID